MNRIWLRLITLLAAAVVLLGSVQIFPSKAEASGLADGWYSIKLDTYKFRSTSLSVMDGFMDKTAFLEVVNGEKWAYVLLKNSDWIRLLEVGEVWDLDYQIPAVDVFPNLKVDEIKGADSNLYDYTMRVVKFPVNTLEQTYEVFTHVIVPTGYLGIVYDNKYDVEFKFQAGTVEPVSTNNLDTQITAAKGLLAIEGAYDSNYNAEHLNALKYLIKFAEAIKAKAGVSAIELNLAGYYLSAGIEAFHVAKSAPASHLFIHTTDNNAILDPQPAYISDVKVDSVGTNKYIYFTVDNSVIERVDMFVNWEANVEWKNTQSNKTRYYISVSRDSDKEYWKTALTFLVKNGSETTSVPIRVMLDTSNDFYDLAQAKADFEAKLIEAETVYANADYGIWENQYPVEQRDALRDKIDELAKLKDKVYYQSTVLRSALADLDGALLAFNASKYGAPGAVSITLHAIHNTNSHETSAVNGYFTNPQAALENGDTYVTLKITDPAVVSELKTSVNGVLENAAVDSQDPSIVKFKVSDLKQPLLAQARITVGSYNEVRSFRFVFNPTGVAEKAALEAAVKAAEAKVAASVTGTFYGQYTASNINTFKNAITAAKNNGNWLATPGKAAAASAALQTAVTTFEDRYVKTATVKLLDETENWTIATDYPDFIKTLSATTYRGHPYFTALVSYASSLDKLRIKHDGVWVNAEVISESLTSSNPQSRSRTFRFPANTAHSYANYLNQIVEAEITVNGTAQKFHILLHSELNKTSLDAAVVSAQALRSAAVVGTEVGQYPQSAVTALNQAIANARSKGNWLATQIKVDEANTELASAVQAFQNAVISTSPGNNNGGGGGVVVPPAGLTDGKYTIDFRIVKNGAGSTSVMDEYVAHPGRLLVENGNKFVMINLKQSNEITRFEVEGASTIVVESDASANTRRVKFPVTDLNITLSGFVKIVWPAANYNHEYDVQIELGSYTKVDNWGAEFFGEPIKRPDPETGSGGTPEDNGAGVPSAGTDNGGAAETDNGSNTGTGSNAGTGANGGSGGETTPNIQFKDTASHWTNSAINRAVQLGIVTGYSNGTFKPSATVNRVEFTVMLSRALKLEGKTSSVTFADHDKVQPWAQASVEQAVAAGIISGFSDNTFRPAQEVTRAEITVMIVRALGLPLESASSLTFSDKASIPAYAQAYVATAVKHGLISGIGGNKFGASLVADRAQAVTLILRAVDLAAANAATTDEAKAA